MYFLGLRMMHGCAGAFPRKVGGIQVLAGLTLFSQTVAIPIENPLDGNAARNKIAKMFNNDMQFANFFYFKYDVC
jgi:hypothetical protein